MVTILARYKQAEKKDKIMEIANAQIAHLFFCRHTGKPKKNQKSYFFANAQNKSNFDKKDKNI